MPFFILSDKIARERQQQETAHNQEALCAAITQLYTERDIYKTALEEIVAVYRVHDSGCIHRSDATIIAQRALNEGE